MGKVSREDIAICIGFIREEVKEWKWSHRYSPDPGGLQSRLLAVADALERILAGEDANKALGLTDGGAKKAQRAARYRRMRAALQLYPHWTDRAPMKWKQVLRTLGLKKSTRYYQRAFGELLLKLEERDIRKAVLKRLSTSRNE
jgi:hypothetical protein